MRTRFARYSDISFPHKLDVYSQNLAGETALHWMATLGDERAVAALINAGAAIDVRDFEGNTPLHHSIQARQTSTTKLLVQSGANAERKNNASLSPREIAETDAYEPITTIF